jgi:tetratricopeptide (TPR) repeat protein
MFSCSGAGKLSDQKAENIEKEEEQKDIQFEYLFVEAIKEKVLGNPQKAIQNLSGCLEIDPGSSAAMYELAGIHAANNDFTSASLLLEKAISINPDNKWYKLLLAKIYQQTNKFVQAAEIYEKLLENDPENMEYLFMKASMFSNAEKFEEAIAAYDQMEQKTGINEQISVAKQQLYISNDEPDKAFEEIEKLIESDPSEPKYYGLLADLYQSQGDSVNALKYYRKIQEIDPDNGFVHLSLANFYFNSGDPEMAYKEIREGFLSEEVDIQSKLQMYLILTASSEKRKVTPEQEEELINILSEAHPDDPIVYTVRAESLLKNNKLEEARGQLLKSLEIQKNDYMLWERVLYIDNDLQDWKSLYEHSNQAMNLFPNQPQVYFLNAVASLQLEKYDETVSISDEGIMYIVENDRMKGQFLMLKGEALYKMGKKDEAFGLFDQAVDMDPDNHIALNNYAYYLSLAGKNLDKAERMSGRVIELFPENATYLDTYAWVLFKKGEYALAKFYMESAINYNKDESPTLYEHYGDILFKLGNVQEALKYWEKAKEKGSDSEILMMKIREKNYIEE